MTTETPEKREFQAEVKQLLDIVTHSLYTDKEIFIRELVSNASDALEKLRYLQLTKEDVFDERLDLEINITTDDAGTVTVQDFGLGMTREELIENLGTIAHSGSRAFLQSLKEGADAGANLIGQFGVGFYSAFMVAKEVKVFTHSWQAEGEHLVWTSDGSGSYEIEPVAGQRRGCKIVVYLKDDCKEFAKADKVKETLTRYSSFVPFPINLNGERINSVQAIWLRNKSEISEEEYNEFYKFQANAFDEPITRLHFSADATLAINALLFVPSENMEGMGMFRTEIGVSLYCRKVLIDDKPEGLLPEWLRFLRGVVDSEDLPLNISRETMQDSALVRRLNTVLTRRFLKHLEEDAAKRPDQYNAFYAKFGIFLKEGITSDFAHREQLGRLLRFESSLTEDKSTTSLADTITRMKDDQAEIYYLHARNRQTIEAGPYLEAFKARNLEVLFLYEPVDEFVMNHLGEFDGKKLVSADQAEIRLEDIPETEGEPLSPEAEKGLCEWLAATLGERVNKVSASKRLVANPAIVLNTDKFLSPGMRKMMKAMNQENAPEIVVNLEINPRHPLIKNLSSLKTHDADLAAMIAAQIHDNAMVAAGFNEDPREMVGRIYDILERVSTSERSVAGGGDGESADT